MPDKNGWVPTTTQYDLTHMTASQVLRAGTELDNIQHDMLPILWYFPLQGKKGVERWQHPAASFRIKL